MRLKIDYKMESKHNKHTIMKKLVLVIVVLIFSIGVTMARPVGNDISIVSNVDIITLPIAAMADVGQMVKLALFTSLLMLTGTKKEKK